MNILGNQLSEKGVLTFVTVGIWNGNVPIWNGTFARRERNSRLASCGGTRLFCLVKFAQLLSKCLSRTKLCEDRSGTVSLRIPSVMLFQTACSVRASRVGENGCMRRKLSS